VRYGSSAKNIFPSCNHRAFHCEPINVSENRHLPISGGDIFAMDVSAKTPHAYRGGPRTVVPRDGTQSVVVRRRREPRVLTSPSSVRTRTARPYCFGMRSK
jgi:hypothetical protein